ncbi:MAG: DUF927 domain-containing protein, partial [Xanthobacteraceae bacterium]|nr:DUF927 domain-containing protein [Xanthobacteraceae bacterium]
REELSSWPKILNRLQQMGAYLSDNEERNERAFVRFRSTLKNAKRITIAKATGWRTKRHKAFVTNFGVVGQCETAVCPPSVSIPVSRNCRGTLANWQKYVATPAAYSSRIGIGILAGLAAPLLDFVDRPSFGLMIFGHGDDFGHGSKTGKSTMQVAAGSTVGFGREQDLPNFGTSELALAEIFSASNDLMLPVNELGLLKGSAQDRYRALMHLAYMLGEGRGTTYSSYAQTAMDIGPMEWRTIVIGSTEQSVDEIAKDARHTRPAGAAVRLVDLPAMAPGSPDIFDLAPATIKPAERAAWFERQCKNLRKHSARNHGVALTHFLEYVIQHRREIEEKLNRYNAKFVDKVAAAETDPLVRHLAVCFGHLDGAGMIGVEAGTLPWSRRQVRRFVMRCYRDARKSLKLQSDRLGQALTRLRKLAGSKRLMVLGTKNPSRHQSLGDGFLKYKAGVCRIVIRGEAFKRWFPDPREPALVLRWLAARGGLMVRGGVPPSGTSIVWAESQPDWPDRKRRRSVVVDLPISFLKTGTWPDAE